MENADWEWPQQAIIAFCRRNVFIHLAHHTSCERRPTSKLLLQRQSQKATLPNIAHSSHHSHDLHFTARNHNSFDFFGTTSHGKLSINININKTSAHPDPSPLTYHRPPKHRHLSSYRNQFPTSLSLHHCYCYLPPEVKHKKNHRRKKKDGELGKPCLRTGTIEGITYQAYTPIKRTHLSSVHTYQAYTPIKRTAL